MEIILLILIGVASRLIPHPANMTAIGGLAIYAGARMNTKQAFLLSFASLLISDLFIGYHPVMWATYGSLAISVFLGGFLRRAINVKKTVFITLISSLIFFILTNFAVWAIPNSMYEKTLKGIFECYVMALPFFRNSVIGDLAGMVFFFGIFERFTIFVANLLHTGFGGKNNAL